MTNHRLTTAPAEPPRHVRAECLAAASLIAGLEERDLTLRIDADAAAGTVRVEVVDAQGRVAACLAGRDVLELLCAPRVPW